MTFVVNTNCNQIEVADDRTSKYTIMAVPKTSRSERSQSGCSYFSKFQINMINVCIVLSIALFLSASTVQGAAIESANSTDASSTSSPEPTTQAVKICHASTPCGWAVYIPFSRRVDYFMKNTCICPSDKACLRHDDDLSISAYVYRCANKPQPETDATPNEE